MTKNHAIFTILSGSVFMSFVGVLLRLLEAANGFQVLFYRSFGLALIVFIFICFRRNITPKKAILSLDWSDFLIGLNLAIAFSMYVFAMFNSSVSSTLFILSITPFLAAVLGWLFLNERLMIGTYFSIFLATLGVVIMVYDGVTFQRSIGNFYAFISGISFALAILFARLSKKKDVLGGTFLGGIFCIFFGFIACLFSVSSFSISFNDFLILIFMGSFTIGIGIMLVTLGTPYVPTSEVCLLVLLESVLGSIWPWVFISEKMSPLEVLGASIIILAIILFSFASRISKTS
mgnify:CR=1 FL=1